MCVCLSVHEDIAETIRAVFTKCFFCILPMTMALSSWRHCNTVFTCVFVDGIIFCYSGLYSDMNFVTKDQFR